MRSTEAKRLLNGHRKQLDKLAEALVSRETLNEKKTLEVTGLPPAPPLNDAMLPLSATESSSAGAPKG
ncbi:MAG TPA: hypothetical protein VL287_03215 [Gemmatimonadales bacterium]|jgi:cell division protease FtsH|nr:hypothetical protein [Gemmatimonadales bacterium]